MEFVCCLLCVGGGIWRYESGRERKRVEEVGRVEEAGRVGQAVADPVRHFPAPRREPWPVCEAVRQARDWSAAVADTARTADR